MGPRERGCQLEHVRTERWDPAPRVDEDRQPALVGLGDDLPHARIAEPEPLGARVQLDAARARRDAAAHLGDGILARVNAAERDEPAA
ncbi:MAG: hypothetical protein QOJ63_2089 [Solirubrobacteraceae bacterium]|nr:hypothetical protein [Solirubrobacteraceae bacterium]